VPVTVTWWGCAAVAIDSGDRAVAIDPFTHPRDGRFEYLFLTHEHYDHLHAPTLETLTRSARFKLAVVARSCVLPSSLFYARRVTWLRPDQLIVLYPKYRERALEAEPPPGPVELRLGGWSVEGVHSPGEEASVPVPIVGPVPQLGYLLRDGPSGVSFYHPGDLCRPYDALAELRGRVDLLFLPLGKLGLDGDRHLLELVRPGAVVPIHYRYEPDYPIPRAYRDDEPIEEQILGFQFPGPDDPDAYVAALAERARPLGVDLLRLRAGRPQTL